jgi:hypothetical protein
MHSTYPRHSADPILPRRGPDGSIVILLNYPYPHLADRREVQLDRAAARRLRDWPAEEAAVYLTRGLNPDQARRLADRLAVRIGDDA